MLSAAVAGISHPETIAIRTMAMLRCQRNIGGRRLTRIRSMGTGRPSLVSTASSSISWGAGLQVGASKVYPLAERRSRAELLSYVAGSRAQDARGDATPGRAAADSATRLNARCHQ